MINRRAIRSSLEMVRNNRAEPKLRLGSIAGFSVHQAACNTHNPQRPEKIDMILQTMSLSKQADLVLFKREGGNRSWLRQCGHSPFPAGDLERQEWISPSHVNVVKTSSYSQNWSRMVSSGRYYCCNQSCAAMHCRNCSVSSMGRGSNEYHYFPFRGNMKRLYGCLICTHGRFTATNKSPILTELK